MRAGFRSLRASNGFRIALAVIAIVAVLLVVSVWYFDRPAQLTHYAAGGNRKVAEWVQGEPKGSFWHGVDLSSASQIPIVTYRCAACGYLEFYARGKELGLIP